MTSELRNQLELLMLHTANAIPLVPSDAAELRAALVAVFEALEGYLLEHEHDPD